MWIMSPQIEYSNEKQLDAFRKMNYLMVVLVRQVNNGLWNYGEVDTMFGRSV